MAGVVIELQRCNGEVLKTLITDASGEYLFNLPEGRFNFRFIKPAGTAFSPAQQGAERDRDSNIDPVTGETGCMAINDGDSRRWFDVGIMP